jgi:hypothetical protein
VSPLYGALTVAGPPVLKRTEPRFDRNLALVPLAVAAGVVLLSGAGLAIGSARAKRRRLHAAERLARARSMRWGPSRFT